MSMAISPARAYRIDKPTLCLTHEQHAHGLGARHALLPVRAIAIDQLQEVHFLAARPCPSPSPWPGCMLGRCVCPAILRVVAVFTSASAFAFALVLCVHSRPSAVCRCNVAKWWQASVGNTALSRLDGVRVPSRF